MCLLTINSCSERFESNELLAQKEGQDIQGRDLRRLKLPATVAVLI
jgi:hypothetical protein